MNQQIELLAPAGSFETMVTAFAAGADAVYLGGARFGARAFADNLDEAHMIEAINYAHLHGKCLYLTVNTLLKTKELEQDLYAYLAPLYEAGLDAVIVQDLGVFHFIREQFPKLPIHASTQMMITGELGAEELWKLGAVRIVTARELSLGEIRTIRETCPELEIESFVHGALCYCYSGGCLFSSIVGGRSGNRGRCAQPCRMPYQVYSADKLLVTESQGYVLSPKDLCTIDNLGEIIEAGVRSLKIEGRMKKPEYTAGVVSIYRKYLDQYQNGRKDYAVSREDKKHLFDLFNRKGFTGGYYKQHNGKDMITLEKPDFRTEDETYQDQLRDQYVNKKLKENIKGMVTILHGKPAIMTISSFEEQIQVQGDLVEKAGKRPLDEEAIRKQMNRMNDTDFQWETIQVQTDQESFYPVGKLNELRRMAVAAWEEKKLEKFRRVISEKTAEKTEISCAKAPSARGTRTSAWSAVVESRAQLDPVLQADWIQNVLIDSHLEELDAMKHTVEQVHQAGKRCFLVLPRIFRTNAKRYYNSRKEAVTSCGFDGVMVQNLEALEYARKILGVSEILADHTLYAYTQTAEKAWIEMGCTGVTLPVELNFRELMERGCNEEELIVYGRLPMMVSAQCIQKTAASCTGKPADNQIKDRMGNRFPVKNYCRECYNIIYNSKPLLLLDVWDQLKKLNPAVMRIQFTTETREETKDILRSFESVLRGEKPELQMQEFTRGHFRRGVE